MSPVRVTPIQLVMVTLSLSTYCWIITTLLNFNQTQFGESTTHNTLQTTIDTINSSTEIVLIQESTEETSIFTTASTLPTVPSQHIQMSKIIINNPNLCGTPKKVTKLSVVIVVLSARENFFQRHLVRETWGSIRTYHNVTIVATVFFLGHRRQPGETGNTTSKIQAEAHQFQDIVSGDFVDTYRNLSRKAILAYEWISVYCSNPDIVVKTDDDMVLNMFELTSELESVPVIESDTFFCYVHENELPIRKGAARGYERYFVSYDEIPTKAFPKHCAGAGYPIRMNLAKRLVHAMLQEPHMVTHEDVYVTGILPGRINALSNESHEGNITYVDKRALWYRWHPKGGVSDDSLLQLGSVLYNNESSSVRDIFHRAYGTTLFFLVLDHGPSFEKEFRQIWERILVNELNLKGQIN